MNTSRNPCGGSNSRANAGLARISAKLKIAFNQANYYEAHQLYRTLYFRLNAQQRFVELEELLSKGSLTFFEVNETESAIDLSKLYIKVLTDGKIPGSDELFNKFAKMVAYIPQDNANKNDIVSEAIKWSTNNPGKFGVSRFHQVLAYYLWDSQRFSESRYHFMHGYDGIGFGTMMAEYHQKCGFDSEADIFIVNTILQLIASKKHIVASQAFNEYTLHNSIIKKGPPYSFPLLNFTWLLLLAIEHKLSVTVYTILIEKYKISLDRDISFNEYLDKIGQLYFGVPPPQPQNSGLFGGMFDSILSSLNNQENPGTSSNTNTSNPNASNSVNAKMSSDDLD